MPEENNIETTHDMDFKNKFQDKYSKYFSWEQPTGKNPMNIVAATENLLLLKQAFDEYGLTFWLVFGTALGAYRDGGFITYDRDTDVAIFYDDIDKLYDITDSLIKKGLLPLRIVTENWPESTGAVGGISYNRKKEYIDVYFFKKTNNKHWCLKDSLHSHWAELHQFDKLDIINFLDREFNIPSDTENYFIDRYGEDWDVPIIGKQATN